MTEGEQPADKNSCRPLQLPRDRFRHVMKISRDISFFPQSSSFVLTKIVRLSTYLSIFVGHVLFSGLTFAFSFLMRNS